MRKALVVGINYYEIYNRLYGCVDDANSVKEVIERHGDETVNFDVHSLTGVDSISAITRSALKDQVRQLFEGDSEIALFYFAGHGHIEITGGYLLTSDSKSGDEGLSLNEVLVFADKSRAKSKIIILDSCHSGIAGTPPTATGTASLSEGLTVLTASTQDQYATEINGRGLFTVLLVDALNGGAANLVGHITPGSVYSYIDQSLGAWEQRPVFKTNVKTFVSLRNVQPTIQLAELKQISEFFLNSDSQLPLDPSFEPEQKGRSEGMPAPIAENTRKFAVLQKYNRANLVIPVDVLHMWNAAMESKSCKLTALGKHYWRLAKKGRI